jgi:hypothetical protein
MIRNLRTLGLAFVAVFAMSAMAASAAQAQEAEFTASEYTATIDATGETDQVFNTSAGELNCTQNGATPDSVQGTGSLAGASPELTSDNIEYRNCEALGIFPVAVNMNGCDYLFTAGEPVAGGSKGSVHIKGCNSGGITIKVFAFGTPTEEVHNETGEVICEIHVPEQTPTSGNINYTNITDESTGKKAVTVEAKDIVVHAEITEGTACNEEEDTNAKYNGAFIATGTDEEEEPIDVTVE